MSQASITIVGIGDDGCLGLSARAHNALSRAQVLVGGERALAFFPDFNGDILPLSGKMLQSVDALVERSHEDNVVVLASGDPLFYGIARLIINKAGGEYVDVIPQPSSMQWAFAKAKITWQDADFISVHGRPMTGIAARLQRLKKVGFFTDAEHSPQRIAARLLEYGLRDFDAVLCENLCGSDERVRRYTLEDLSRLDEVSPLNVLILEKRLSEGSHSPLLDLVAEEAYGKRIPKKGLITKKEVRVLSLAAMGLREDSVVWDIGAGSGSISVEAGRLASEGQIFAIECDLESVAFIEENAKSFGMDHITAVHGMAPMALSGLPKPHAVFVGGSKGSMAEICEQAAHALHPGGRLVVNAVTLENVASAHQAMKGLGWEFEMSQISVSRGSPLAKKYLRYEALNPIHIFYTQKPLFEEES